MGKKKGKRPIKNPYQKPQAKHSLLQKKGTGQDVVMNGAEIRIDGEVLPHFHLQFNMSYVNGTVEANGKPLERIPPLNGKFVLSYAPSPFHFHVTPRFAGSQTRLGM